MPKTANDYLKREQELDTRRNYWKNHWQLVSEYVNQRRADFTTSRQAGAFIHSHLWTDDPVHMAETAASAFLGYIWSAGVKSFKLVGNPNVFGKEDSKFWGEATEILQDEMDDQEAGLATALDESMLDLIVLGTDGIYIEERNEEKPKHGCLLFEPWSISAFSLSENAAKRADTFYRRREFKVGQLVEKYGYKNCSAKVKKLYDDGQRNVMVKVLHVIEPRDESHRTEGSRASKDMPFASVHIDCDNKKIMRNSGYMELPVACARLAKRIGEEYGRGRGMNALPSIMMLNQVMEDFMLAVEKNLDPPMYQIHDAVSGNGFIDTSAGAINILKIDKGLGNVSPTGKLFDIQNIQNAPEIIQMLSDTISNHFMIDRLINMNNDTQMTKGEAFLRNAIRQATLRSIVSRIMQEKFDVLINTAFMICLRRNKFGYMPNDPEAVAMEAEGKEVNYLPESVVAAIDAEEDLYKIEYLTPAARDAMAEEGQGMVEMLQITAEMAAFDETAKHRVDTDWTLHRLTEIKGADRRMWKNEKDVQKAVEKERAAQEEAQAAALMQQMGRGVKDLAQADETT